MSIEVNMPKFGATMTEGEISKILKNEGDKVKKGDALVEVMTDKITNVVEAPTSGVVEKILYKEGDAVEIAKPIITIKED